MSLWRDLHESYEVLLYSLYDLVFTELELGVGVGDPLVGSLKSWVGAPWVDVLKQEWYS